MIDTIQTRYRVTGMDCAACAAKIYTAVRRMPGVADVAVSATAGSMTVHHRPDIDLATVEKKVAGLGYGTQRAAGAPDRTATKDHDACCGHDHGSEDHDHRGHEHDHGHGR